MLVVLLFLFIMVGNNIALVSCYAEYTVQAAQVHQRTQRDVRRKSWQKEDPGSSASSALGKIQQQASQQGFRFELHSRVARVLETAQQTQRRSAEVSSPREGEDLAFEPLQRLVSGVDERISTFRGPWSASDDPLAGLMGWESPIQAVYEVRWQLRSRFAFELSPEDVVKLRNILKQSQDSVSAKLTEAATDIPRDADYKQLVSEADVETDLSPDTSGPGTDDKTGAWETFKALLQDSTADNSEWRPQLPGLGSMLSDASGTMYLKDPMLQKGFAVVNDVHDVVILMFDSCKGILQALSWLRSQKYVLEVVKVENHFARPFSSGWQEVALQVRVTHQDVQQEGRLDERSSVTKVVLKVVLWHRTFSKIRDIVVRCESEVAELLHDACPTNGLIHCRWPDFLQTAFGALQVAKTSELKPRAGVEAPLLGVWKCQSCMEKPFGAKWARLRPMLLHQTSSNLENQCPSCGDLLFASRITACEKCGILHPNPLSVAGELERYLELKGIGSDSKNQENQSRQFVCPKCGRRDDVSRKSRGILTSRRDPCPDCKSRLVAANMLWTCPVCHHYWRRCAKLCFDGIIGGIQFAINSAISEWTIACCIAMPECMGFNSPREVDVSDEEYRRQSGLPQLDRLKKQLRQSLPPR